MSFCIPYAIWLIHILDWLLSSDSAKSWPAFHADSIGKNAKAATLDSLCSLKGKKKPHCFPAVVLLSPPCCVHSIGICSLFTALMTGFKNISLKTELSDREIFSICNSFAGCWLYCSSSWEVPVDRRQRQMHAGDMLTENKTQENNICLGGRSSWRNAGSPELPSFPETEPPHSTAGREPASLITAEIVSMKLLGIKRFAPLKLHSLQWPFIVSNPSTLNMIT